MTNSKRGFTLIELLVVIAIIGVLSSIVLVNLRNARNRAAEASVRSNLSTVKAQAALIYEQNDGNYGSSANWFQGSCPVSSSGSTLFHQPKIFDAIQKARADGGTANPVCNTNNPGASTVPLHAYLVSVSLKTGGYWCIDSSGIARRHPNAVAGGNTTCP